jgi:hypothetical protein
MEVAKMGRREFDLTVTVPTPFGEVTASIDGRLPPAGHEHPNDPDNDGDVNVRSASLTLDGVSHDIDVDEMSTLAVRYGGGWVALDDVLRSRAVEEARA